MAPRARLCEKWIAATHSEGDRTNHAQNDENNISKQAIGAGSSLCSVFVKYTLAARFSPVLAGLKAREIALMMAKLLWLAAAGALGSLARYGLSGLVQRSAGPEFPWGTLAVNAAGCFLAGLFAALWEHHGNVTGETRTIVLIGFMGAFTTFSSFMLETGELLRDGEWFWAFGNVALQNGLGLFALFLGIVLGRMV